jgi:hypothetical protein
MVAVVLTGQRSIDLGRRQSVSEDAPVTGETHFTASSHPRRTGK